MPTVKPMLRRAALLFGMWTVVGLVFAAISYGIARGENNSGFGLAEALRLNLVQFYLWGILSLPIFVFSRRFPIEVRPLRHRNLLLHFPALLFFAALHQALHLLVLWSTSARMRKQFPSVLDCYRAYFGLGFYIDLIIASLIIIAVHALLYYRRFRASELEQASLKAQLAQAELKGC
jgi:hypothetical protein